MNTKYLSRAALLSYLPHLLIAVILVCVAYARIRLLNVPLERDEGEYAYIGQLMLKGIPPYLHAYSMKLPGTAAAYALFMALFGQTPFGIHLGLLITNGLCIILLYQVSCRLLERDSALIACALFALLSVSQTVDGVFAHATHFVVLFTLAGLYLLLLFEERRKPALIACCGLCFGLAILMKQHAAILSFFPASYLVWRWHTSRHWNFKSLIIFAAGTTLPYSLLVVYLLQAGLFDVFRLWTFDYALSYVTATTLAEGIALFYYHFSLIVQPYPLVWLLVSFGIVLMATSPEQKSARFFISGLALFSFLSIFPRFEFREHYFIMIMPVASMLAGAALTWISRRIASATNVTKPHFIIFLTLIATSVYGMHHERAYLFLDPPLKVSRTTYGPNPFPEAPEIAAYIKERTGPEDRIAILGSEPEILFYADRISASGHIYMYSLMENHPFAELMQQQAIRQIIAAKPRYVVKVNIATSWLQQPESILTIQEWSNDYLKSEYLLDSVIDILGPDKTLYLWGREAKDYRPRSEFNVSLYVRREQ